MGDKVVSFSVEGIFITVIIFVVVIFAFRAVYHVFTDCIHNAEALDIDLFPLSMFVT